MTRAEFKVLWRRHSRAIEHRLNVYVMTDENGQRYITKKHHAGQADCGARKANLLVYMASARSLTGKYRTEDHKHYRRVIRSFPGPLHGAAA